MLSCLISLVLRLVTAKGVEGVDTKLIVVGVCCVLAALVGDAGRGVGFVDDDDSVVVVSIAAGLGCSMIVGIVGKQMHACGEQLHGSDEKVYSGYPSLVGSSRVGGSWRVW